MNTLHISSKLVIFCSRFAQADQLSLYGAGVTSVALVGGSNCWRPPPVQPAADGVATQVRLCSRVLPAMNGKIKLRNGHGRFGIKKDTAGVMREKPCAGLNPKFRLKRRTGKACSRSELERTSFTLTQFWRGRLTFNNPRNNQEVCPVAVDSDGGEFGAWYNYEKRATTFVAPVTWFKIPINNASAGSTI